MTHYLPPKQTQPEIEQLAQAFEDGSLPASHFNHLAHLTVALWYLSQLPYNQAAERMCANLRLYAARHHHGQRYHETITQFWLKLLHHCLQSAPAHLPLEDRVHHILIQVGQADLIFRHFSRARLFSPEARRAWIEPDLAPLPTAGA